MKKYGTAEYIMALIQSFVESKAEQLSKSEKNRLIGKCKNMVENEYPSARDTEVA